MIRIDIQKVRLELIAPSDIAGDNLVVEPEFFEQNRDFLAVWRRPKVDIEHPCSFLVEVSCGLNGSRQSGDDNLLPSRCHRMRASRKSGVVTPGMPLHPRLKKGGQAAFALTVGSAARAARRISSAPFSAIMMVGALVLVEVTVGTTDASMTRSRSSPWTHS